MIVAGIKSAAKNAMADGKMLDISDLTLKGSGYKIIPRDTEVLKEKYGRNMENLRLLDPVHQIYGHTESQGVKNWEDMTISPDVIIAEVAFDGDLNKVERYFERGVTQDGLNKAMINAVINGHWDIVSFLEDNIHQAIFDGGYLYEAVGTGEIKIVEYIVNNSSFDVEDLTDALAKAVRNNYNDIAELLLQCGADVHHENDYVLKIVHNNYHNYIKPQMVKLIESYA